MRQIIINVCKLLSIMMLFSLFNVPIASAEDEMFDANYGQFKNEDYYYDLDLVTQSDVDDATEEKGFFASIADTFDLSNISDGVMEAIYYVFFMIIEFFFSFNLFMTNLMISILDFAYDTNIVNPRLFTPQHKIPEESRFIGVPLGFSFSLKR